MASDNILAIHVVPHGIIMTDPSHIEQAGPEGLGPLNV